MSGALYVRDLDEISGPRTIKNGHDGALYSDQKLNPAMVFGRVFSRKSQSSVGEVLKGKDALSGNVELKYFDIGPKGSRGGPVRFMLQLHEVDFDENKIAPDASWMDVKKQLIESGENPCGTLPILTIDGNTYFHHLPILRLLAAKFNAVSIDPEVVYVSNVVLDEYTGRRNAFGDTSLSEENKANYIAKRETFYELLEILYGKRKDTSSPFLMGLSVPGFDDLAVFSLLYDDKVVFGEVNMDKYPTLKQIYETVEVVPRIAEWIKSMNPQLVAESSTEAVAEETKTEAVPEAKTETTPEAKTETEPEAKTETAPEAAKESAPEEKTEPAPAEAKTSE